METDSEFSVMRSIPRLYII